jgi:NAD(P)-dependent dehydrogenase (short-subunit alcohol dehydrogenase family)
MNHPEQDHAEQSTNGQEKLSRRQLLGSAGAMVAGMTFANNLNLTANQSDSAAQSGTQSGSGAQASAANQTWAGVPFGQGPLHDRIAVITGAARGIGRAIAVDMAANGAHIVGIDICAKVLPFQEYVPATREDLEETGRLVRQRNRKFTAEVGDIRDITFLRAVADRAQQQYGGIDIVVADAGTQFFKPLLEMEDAHWLNVIDNNLNGTANTIRAFGPKLVLRGKGRIIVLASMQGKHGSKNMSSYSASKWGIIGLMKSAALELGKDKITVNALIPGLVDTPLTHNEKRWSEMIGEVTADPNPPKNPTEEEAAKIRAPHVPLKVPWLQPEDLAPAAVFLASDFASMVTGACYDVTAGDDANNQS